MLIKFSAENFGAIGKKQEINMGTGKARGKSFHLLKAFKQSVLRFISIYGGNAAGKSTMIKAMHFGKRMVLNGYLDKRFLTINRSSDIWVDKPSEFVYTIFIEKKKYEYGFCVRWVDETIIKEWLYEENSRQEKKMIFVRDFVNNDFGLFVKSKSEVINNRLLIYFSDAQNEKNTLFLKEINTKKGDLFESDISLQYLRAIYRWFQTKLKFVYPNDSSDLGRYSFLNYPENNDKLYDCLAQMDSPITNMSYVKSTVEQAFRDVPSSIVEGIESDFKEMFLAQDNSGNEEISVVMRLDDNYYIIEADDGGIKNIKTIQLTHGKYGKYEFREESDGTKRILELLEIITSPEQDVTYIVDEIDRSLHPLLTEKLVSMYLNSEKSVQSQLIITTHESRLLNLKNLRKDEIYFATSQCGESEFIRLDEFEISNPRTDLNIETAYLNGRYGGVPTLIQCQDLDS
ncbi:MAG: AAA family ATPase [Eubacteriaceae bacterium]